MAKRRAKNRVLLLTVQGTGTRFVRDVVLAGMSQKHVHFTSVMNNASLLQDTKKFGKVVVTLRDPVLTLNSSAYRKDQPNRVIEQWRALVDFDARCDEDIYYLPIDRLADASVNYRLLACTQINPNVNFAEVSEWRAVRTPVEKPELTEAWLNQAIPKLRRVPGLVPLLQREGYNCPWFTASLERGEDVKGSDD